MEFSIGLISRTWVTHRVFTFDLPEDQEDSSTAPFTASLLDAKEKGLADA